VIVSSQFPATTIIHLGFDNVPIFIIVETIPGNRGSDRSGEWLVKVIWCLVDRLLGKRCLARIAVMVSLVECVRLTTTIQKRPVNSP
jgi:hypothetical protein